MSAFEKAYDCLNGPCVGRMLIAPADATPGTACALGWKTIKGQDRFAVYILVDWNGQQGLMFVQNYTKPDHAASKVQRLTALCAQTVS